MSGAILQKEIYEQPQVINELLEAESSNVKRIARDLAGSFEYILIAARGSSDNAARYAQYLFGSHNRVPVALATPSLFTIYRQPPRLAGALVIGISQSGQSPDIVQVLKEACNQNRPTIAITNDFDSPLAQIAKHVVYLHAGAEKAVAATKTYTASLTALALFSAYLQGSDELIQQLQALPKQMENILSGLNESMERVERYRYMGHCAVIGRGLNYSTAFEIALKIKELTRIVAEPYSSADFRHGPIAMVHEGFPVLIIAPSGEVNSDVKELVSDILRRKCELLMISDQSELLGKAHLAFSLPEGTPEWISPLAAVLPGQMFALQLARAKGLDPDSPAGIQKVTETL